MTVRQLIEKLLDYPLHAVVTIPSDTEVYEEVMFIERDDTLDAAFRDDCIILK